jgi:hypothetical protein
VGFFIVDWVPLCRFDFSTRSFVLRLGRFRVGQFGLLAPRTHLECGSALPEISSFFANRFASAKFTPKGQTDYTNIRPAPIIALPQHTRALGWE